MATITTAIVALSTTTTDTSTSGQTIIESMEYTYPPTLFHSLSTTSNKIKKTVMIIKKH